MKTKFTILILMIISCFLSFGQSAETAYGKEKILKKAISPNIMAKSVKAFQIKSESKIADFYSYLNILGNKTVQDEMKQHTIIEIKKLFKDENISIPNFLDESKKILKLDDFLNEILKSTKSYAFEVVDLQESVIQNNNGTSSWTISYSLNITKGKQMYSIKNIMQNALVVQENKSFGKQSKTVVTTYLTDIWMK